MSWIADAHREWHAIHGWNTCPLDCYEVEARNEEAYLASLSEAELADHYA